MMHMYLLVESTGNLPLEDYLSFLLTDRLFAFFKCIQTHWQADSDKWKSMRFVHFQWVLTSPVGYISVCPICSRCQQLFMIMLQVLMTANAVD